MEIQKWEYHTVTNEHASSRDWPGEFLNKLGSEGWELISVVSESVGGLFSRTFVFKRPAQLPSNIVFTSDLKKTTEDNVPGGFA